MMKGDISNQRSYVIAIRCEDCLLKRKDTTIKDRVLNKILGPKKSLAKISGRLQRTEVDKHILSMMNYIYWCTEYTLILVVDTENYSDEFLESIEDLPFSQVLNCKISEVASKINVGEITYYIDTDVYRLSLVNSKYALTPDQFNTILRRKPKRPQVTY